MVLITLDTTRADHLGSYGYERETSPHLDALAADAVRFDMAIAQSAATPISHASILTGLNPYQHGLRVMYATAGYRLPKTVPTLSTVLGKHGKQTAAFLSSFTVSEFFGLDRGFDVFDNGMSPDAAPIEGDDGKWRWDPKQAQRRSDATTDRAVAWLRTADPSFFLWVHYWDPHDTAVLPPEADFRSFAQKEGGPEANQLLLMYDAEIHFMDAQIGRLLEELKALDLYENTIIIVIGDHGQGLGDHDWFLHRLLYQEQIRIPMIVRVPGVRPRVVEDLVRSIDVLPTVLDALGMDGPPVEGRSALGLMVGKREEPRIAYADALNLYDQNASIAQKRPLDDLLYCAMDSRWKLIYRPTNPPYSELYNLDEDPAESRNLYATAGKPRQRLMAALREFDGFVDQPFGHGDMDPDVRERLESLGYIGNE